MFNQTLAATSFKTLGVQGVSGFPFVAGLEVRLIYMLNPSENVKIYACVIHTSVRPNQYALKSYLVS
jgi:hypothetical protein